MKKVSRRAVAALFLAGAIVVGLVFFLGMYIKDGRNWATFTANAHIYSGGNLKTGKIFDRTGEVLVQTVDGVRKYNDDPVIRKATLHAVGDTYGNISTGMQSNYSDKLVGFDYLNGLYSLTGEGNNLYLTLYAQVCAEALDALDGRFGAVGVYNYKTGEIYCMVSSPTYDPENVPDIANDTTGAYDGVYINRFLSAAYVPGSIFKLVATAAAIETIPDIFQQQFTCTGSYEIEGDTITCMGVHGTLDFYGALAHSCNSAYAQIALQLRKETLTEYAQKAGATQSITFDGLSTTPGHFDLSDAALSDMAWAAIGQYTDQINPCSYMTFMGAIANGGTMVYPHILSKITTGANLTIQTGKTVTGDRILSEYAAGKLADMMRNNVETVYGAWNYPGLDICAKSGTAEIGGGIAPHATFSGFIRSDEYPLAFVVIVENSGSGSSVSGVIANRVLQKTIELMGKE